VDKGYNDIDTNDT